MNDFREWLSDNLRYIMLGFGIILLLLFIFLGIRFVTGLVTEPTDEQVQTEMKAEVITPTPEPAPETTPEVTPEVTPTPEITPVISDKLEKNAVPEVFTLIGTYYTAIAEKDIATLRGLVDNLTAEDEGTITTSTVEAYSNINVYTKAQTNGSYVTFVSYKYKLTGISTLVPGLSQLYVCPSEDGSLYISTAAPSAEVQTSIEETVKSAEVQTLVTQIQAEYDAALASDPALNAYFNPESVPTEDTPSEDVQPEDTPSETPTTEPTEEPTPTPTPEPVSVVLKSSAFFRDAPSMDSNVMSTISGGTEMLKLGEGDGWFHVRIDGQDGYIAARFF